MEREWTIPEKDSLLREALNTLSTLGFQSKWAESPNPYSVLKEECTWILSNEEVLSSQLKDYLRKSPLIPKAVEMLITYLAMSANAKWNEVPLVIQPVAARGWFLGRWLPTFLIVDGPISRYLCKAGSPLYEYLKSNPSRCPLLAAARDFLNKDLCRRLRNGFAHWTFDWEIAVEESSVVVYDYKNASIVARMTPKELDFLHLAIFSIIEILEDTLLQPFLKT